MQKPDENFMHKWHVAVNQHNSAVGYSETSFMYDAMRMRRELPRLIYLFHNERNGTLPQTHKQCSMSEDEPIMENFLTCCLGVKCLECQHLNAIEKTNLTDAEKNEAKALTCVAHIEYEKGRHGGMLDDSEGYIHDVSEGMYWERLHESLAKR